jgi:CBS domain-containing protein
MDKPRKTAKQLLDIKKQAGSFSVSANSTVKAALEVLSEKNIGAVLVMEGTKLVGIFSERDYARKGELQGRAAGSTAIREVMTSNIASVTPGQMVEECRRIMGERRIRHLPVLDGEKVIGVLSSKDILDEIIAEDEKLIRDLETERLLMTTTAGNY